MKKIILSHEEVGEQLSMPQGGMNLSIANERCNIGSQSDCMSTCVQHCPNDICGCREWYEAFILCCLL
jgi:hypothetical protein